jgi:hypothetical protein
MYIAKEKRKNNIAEYILYMWQIEDLIRAHNCDFDKINRELISQYKGTEEQIREIRKWYKGLTDAMLIEGIKDNGHLQFLVLIMDDVNNFHFRLIDSSTQGNYQKLYMESVRDISELRKRMGDKEQISDVEVCLTALYGLLLMRLKGREVTEDTEKVFNRFSELMSELSRLYNLHEKGILEI